MSDVTRRQLLAFLGAAAATAIAEPLALPLLSRAGHGRVEAAWLGTVTPVRVPHPLPIYQTRSSWLPDAIGVGHLLPPAADPALATYVVLDDLIIAPELERYIIVRWGERLFPNPDDYVGNNHDYTSFLPLNGRSEADGVLWMNQTLADYRGNFAYNLLDAHKRRFCAEVPFLVQWDDHETRNNWYPGQMLGDERYRQRSASLLAAYARRAMLEYNAMRIDPGDPERIYRSLAYGPSLDVFMLDERSYRGSNSPNRQAELGDEAAFLGSEQLRWLKRALLASRATWKVIASDMPISLVVPDLNPDVPKGTYEGWANGDNGVPSGRELELASLLSFVKNNAIKNVVWLTADVHYAQAAYYSPSGAQFQDFLPFWEFVAGPINAGTFGPNELDLTFGPEIRYQSVTAGMTQNLPPTEGKQYFGAVRIDGATEVMTVSLNDVKGDTLFRVSLDPEA